MTATRFFAAMALWITASIAGITSAQAENITVYSAGSVPINESRQLTAYVPLSPNTVTWSVNGIAGGNETVGTITEKGLYSAPAVPPADPAVSVRATSTAYPTKSDAVTINVTQVPVQLWSVAPTSGPVGAFTLSLNGANFGPSSVASIEGVAVTTTYISVTKIKVSGTTTAAQAGTKLTVKVTNPGLGTTTSGGVSYAVATADAPTTPTNPSEPKTPTTPPVTPTPTVTLSLSPAAASLAPFGTRQFTATVSGSTNASVSYSVNGVAGGNTTVGTITGEGLYTAPAASSAALTVTIRATSAAAPTVFAQATVTVSGPPNAGTSLGTPNLAAARFLEQATFGPTPAAIAKVQQMGVNAWLDEQFNAPETAIPDPGAMNSGQVKAQYISRLSTADDQLRQRVAYALQQIIVISMNKNIYPNEIVPYLQILSHNAFGNYRTLLSDISTSAQMGKYLDIANSNKPAPGAGAIENYPRELLQLFTIGLWQLNPDGTFVLDQNNKSIPTYDQATVQQVALAFTGWTYQGTGANNWENFNGSLIPKDGNHDMRAKSFLGCNLVAGQSTVSDLNATLDCIFSHPNVAPFIASRLIRNLVVSNPSPAYVARVAAVFNNNGSGVKGDLKATVRAILTDPEARNDADSTGRLRDPTQHLIALTRALGGTITPANQLSWQMSRIGQEPLTPPSVFGFYSQFYRVPRTTLVGPEFQIYSPTDAVLRGNLLWQALTNGGSDFTIDLAPITSAPTTVDVIDRVDQALLYGRMPQPMRQTIANVLATQDTVTARTQMALYLTALSGLYAVQH